MELGKLIPPPELESDWKTFISGAQTLAENTSKLGEYAKATKLKSAKALIKSSTTTQQRMVAIAKRDGLKECEEAPNDELRGCPVPCRAWTPAP